MKIAKLYRFLFLIGTATLWSSLANAQAGSAEQNFPAWTAISHKLEKTPLDPQVNRDAEVAIQELSASPDFHTPLCSSFFTFFNHLTATGYPYQAQIYRLYILGSATYRIETGKTDAYGTNLYAFTSVLKGYSALLDRDRSKRDKTMDDLLITDLAGKLPDRLKKDSTCK
jgi:hypothetical protein